MRRVLFLTAVFVCLTVSTAKAQDPVQVDGKHLKVEFENDQVRVLRENVGAHEKVPMHEHPNGVVILLTDHDQKSTTADGNTTEIHGKAGEVQWRPATKHMVENIGEKPLENIHLELKGNPAAAQPAIRPALDPAKVDPKHCKVEFENDQVRGLRWNTGPHEKIPLHEHPAYVGISLTDRHGRLTLPDGKTKEFEAKAGQTSWNEPQKHSYENLSDSASESIDVELKAKPAAPKHAAKKPGT